MGINIYFSDKEGQQVLDVLRLFRKDNPLIGLAITPMIATLEEKLKARGVVVDWSAHEWSD